MSFTRPKVPGDGSVFFRGAAGTMPSLRRVSTEANGSIQISPSQQGSKASVISCDPKSVFVECVDDQTAAPTMGITKKNPMTPHLRNCCFRLKPTGDAAGAAAADSSRPSWPQGMDEISFMAHSAAQRTEWIRFFVDLGALARGEASTALQSGGGGGDDVGGGAKSRNAGGRSGSDNDDDDDNSGNENDRDGDSDTEVQAYDPNAGFPGVTESTGKFDLSAFHNLTNKHNAPNISQPLRPAPPYTLVLPQIKVDRPPLTITDSGASSAAPTPPQPATIPGHGQTPSPPSAPRTRWAPVSTQSNAIYRCLRSTVPHHSHQYHHQQPEHRHVNADLWERHILELSMDFLPTVDWAVARPPSLEDIAQRAAVEALHAGRQHYSDPRVFGAPWGELDKDALEQVALGSVDVAYSLIAAARHSCDDPCVRPVKCVALLCALGDVNPEKLRYRNRQQQSPLPDFVRFAGASFLELRRSDQTLRVFNGREFEFSCSQSDIVTLSNAGVAGLVERICTKMYTRWVSPQDVETVLKKDETIPPHQELHQKQQDVPQHQHPQQDNKTSGTAPALEHPTPLVLTLRPQSENGRDLHLVLLFKWAVRADNAARAMRSCWLPAAQSAATQAAAIPTQRASRISHLGFSFFTMEPTATTPAGKSREEMDAEINMRIQDVASKWTLLNFCATRDVASKRKNAK